MSIVLCRRLHFAAVGAAAALMCGAAGLAAAEPASPYPELLRAALTRTPRLAAAEAEVARARGLSDQAAARPNPTASLEVENFAGAGPYSGLGGAETTLSVGQPVELGGKRGARMAAGRAELAAAEARRAQAVADFAYDLGLAYAEADAAAARRTLAAEALGVAEEDARAARALVEAGKEADVRALQADSIVAAARAELNASAAEIAAALARLTALAGAPAPFTSLGGEVLSIAAPPPAAVDELDAPAVLSARAEREAAVRRVVVERVKAAPDLTASVGVRRLGLDDATALVAGISAPLPIFDRNRGAVSAAQAGVRAADARLEAARLDAEAEIRTAQVQSGAAETRLAAAVQAETNAGEISRLTRIGYEGGKLSLLELINARRAEAEARTRALDARLARARALASLARVQGRAPFGASLP